MSFETKSLLAKLLAEENVSVIIDSNASTASFDMRNRVIRVPNWDDTSPDLYDLLLGHEVGHARHTPAEGWHDAIVSEKERKFKMFLNVCEDARIEKKIKRRYPGLRASMLRGYKELMARDMFSIQGKNVSKFLLIDRINLSTKLGSMVQIPFTAEEKVLLNEVLATETWEQVVEVARKVWEYCKQELKDKREEEKNKADEEEMPSFSDEEDEESEQYEDGDSDNESDDSDEESEQEMSGSAEDDEEEDSDEEESEESIYGAGNPSDDDEPESVTDKAFRENESKLAAGGALYTLKLPGNVEDFIIPLNDLVARINGASPASFAHKDFDKIYDKFLAENRTVIDQYLKEFVMRQSAQVWKKARTADTGDIDPAKLANYRLTDQIFKARTVLPSGKNHGMMMLMDWSSSMAPHFENAVQQMLVLVHFCKKAGIPFSVHGFTQNYANANKSFNVREFGTIHLENDFVLFEMLNSDMKPQAFKRMATYLLHWAKNAGNPYSWNPEAVPVSTTDCMYTGGTPLNEALTGMMKLIPKFREKYRVDRLSLIVMNDGDTNAIREFTGPDNRKMYARPYDGIRFRIQIGKVSYNLNKVNGDYTSYLNRYIREEMGVEVYGFFLMGNQRRRWTMSAIHSLAINKDGTSFYDAAAMQLKEDGYFESYVAGYSRYFVMRANNPREIELSENATLNQITKAFGSKSRGRKLNRIIATKFMELAA